MSDDEEMRYCAKCGDPEFDKDDEPTHDYEPYDHDFEPEEDGITIQDVKDGLDVIGKGLDVANKYKKLTETNTPRPPMEKIPPFIPRDEEIENEIEKTRKVFGKTSKKEKENINPIGTLAKHKWSRGEKIGIAGLGVGILGIVLYILL